MRGETRLPDGFSIPGTSTRFPWSGEVARAFLGKIGRKHARKNRSEAATRKPLPGRMNSYSACTAMRLKIRRGLTQELDAQKVKVGPRDKPSRFQRCLIACGPPGGPSTSGNLR